MCGIAGYIDVHGKCSNQEMHDITKKMLNTIVYRGPDDEGIWLEHVNRIAFGHRRLSILDLSPEGHQPMHSASDRFVIVYNGEIYNFRDIRAALEKNNYCFRGHSDTEVILAAFEEWGIYTSVQKFIGMFAMAVWDKETRLLHLVRDRMGEKPLYYGYNSNLFIFASELKPIKAHPEFIASINRNALASYLRHNYIPAPHTIYENVYKLMPGTIATIDCSAAQVRVTSTYYWSPKDVISECIGHPLLGTDKTCIEELDHILKDAVAKQMVADVPLGAFLSGGIDSSTVVALMQLQSTSPVKTFSIGFEEQEYNEAEHAKAVARHLGTDHTELYITPQDAIDIIPKLHNIYDEPFSDSSQIPTTLVAALAKRKVTVSLSGDAGDELFGGYSRYLSAKSIWHKLNCMPLLFREHAMNVIKLAKPLYSSAVVPDFLRDKVEKVADSKLITAKNFTMFYRELVSHYKYPEQIVLRGREAKTIFTDENRIPIFPELYSKMMYIDLLSYLPDDILVKVDRSCMSVSLESRVPFLDHRVVEFAWKLPLHMKVRNGQGKWILRQVLYKYVPKELIDRPKKGFGVPIGTWLRGPLKEWAETLLDENRLTSEGYFNPVPIREKWREHLEGKNNWQAYLWDILMFQQWLENNK